MRNLTKSSLVKLLFAVCLMSFTANTVWAQEVYFRTYQDATGFSCEFPSDWSFSEGTNSDRFFSGPPETAYSATIVIQVIDRELTAEKTPEAQLAALVPQFLNFAEGKILTEGTAAIGEQEVPFLIASYMTNDTAENLREFRHIQMVVTTPRTFLLMSYSSPDGTFDKTMKVFQHCSATLKIVETDTRTSPVKPEESNAVDDLDAISTDDTLLWRHNSDRNFWIAVPSSWTKEIDEAEPYSVDMQHPDRIEGVLVFVVDLDASTSEKDYADALEQVLAKEIFFMNDRLAVPQQDHPNGGLVREYQGEINGATLRSVTAFMLDKKRGYSVVGYHFIGDDEGENRIRNAVKSFRLVAPD